LENYQKPPRRPRSRQTSDNRSANNSKIQTRDNENDRKLPSTNNYDNQGTNKWIYHLHISDLILKLYVLSGFVW